MVLPGRPLIRLRSHQVTPSWSNGKRILLFLFCFAYSVACVGIFFLRPTFTLQDDKSIQNSKWGQDLLHKPKAPEPQVETIEKEGGVQEEVDAGLVAVKLEKARKELQLLEELNKQRQQQEDARKRREEELEDAKRFEEERQRREEEGQRPKEEGGRAEIKEAAKEQEEKRKEEEAGQKEETPMEEAEEEEWKKPDDGLRNQEGQIKNFQQEEHEELVSKTEQTEMVEQEAEDIGQQEQELEEASKESNQNEIEEEALQEGVYQFITSDSRCISYSSNIGESDCREVLLLPCSKDTPEQLWGFFSFRLTAWTTNSCLEETSFGIRACPCSESEKQEWLLSKGQISSFHEECVINTVDNDLVLVACNEVPNPGLWKLQVVSKEAPDAEKEKEDKMGEGVPEEGVPEGEVPEEEEGEKDQQHQQREAEEPDETDEKVQNQEEDEEEELQIQDEEAKSNPDAPKRPEVPEEAMQPAEEGPQDKYPWRRPPKNSNADPETLERVRDMMKLAWSNYERYAWGADELKPVSRSPRNWLGSGLAATVVDAIDTLLIMGLDEEYEKARDYIATKLSFDHSGSVSFFETVIRDLGGLLAVYGLTKDRMYVDKAADLGDRLLGAFQSPSGLPYSTIDLTSRRGQNHNWNPSNHILAEVGTIQLEFKYLSEVTGNPIYAEKANRVNEILKKEDSRDPGLYPVMLNEHSGSGSGNQDYTLGGLGDSFYEYLLKQWIQTNKTETRFKKWYIESAEGIKSLLVDSAQVGSDTYFYTGKYNHGFREPMMEHLACFAGGMFAFGAATGTTADEADDMRIGRELTKTCRTSYIHQATGLGPEKFSFHSERMQEEPGSTFYILRPEYIESLFYLWRITKNPIYREWGKDAINAIETHCKTENGYSGIENVNSNRPRKTDVQESFFLAETLKYLYLLYADDSLISLDSFVFNTEAHPLPVFTPTKFDFSNFDALA